ncbi:IS30 family transposase [Nocardioides sp. QY071]|uniref:IS30 family transposase n=1 Tax=Nocardioides sp. QY071 TaxID=3044187 RepID=UPI00249B4E33|nr:IS30 family transposase [Nocardioides sp. QY071]WGX99657.1 IS30 family transposase [Nocardioides sp. QY071]WGY00312.1 IS30 family transposase [Nocardioides sp. QY071]WGY03018.1 IS30 family transposase [Nocardioides sp. QY071]WGY04161.1 IS30 family transposase [Nocardioides sp. QY071]
MAGKRLTAEKRSVIERGYRVGLPQRTIAALVGVHPSTISRELRRHRATGYGSRSVRGRIARGGGKGYRNRYDAASAQEFADRRARRRCRRRLDHGPLREKVWELLRADWSPQQIAAMLPVMFPDDEAMRVSHETIYQALFVQTKGQLKRELTQHLRSKRMQRKPQASAAKRSSIRLSDDVLISARPAEVEDRAVPGHWEGDLLMGAKGKGSIITLVERSSRYVLLAPIPGRHTAETTRMTLAQLIATLPTDLVKSITWDRGTEMAEHARFKVETGVSVYFCDPYSPWQRGSNENTNGLLRQYWPKSSDLTGVTQTECDDVALRLNTRPRMTLNWQTPGQVLNEALVATAG